MTEKRCTEIQKAEAGDGAFADEIGQERASLIGKNVRPPRSGLNVGFEVDYARYSVENRPKMVLKHYIEGC